MFRQPLYCPPVSTPTGSYHPCDRTYQHTAPQPRPLQILTEELSSGRTPHEQCWCANHPTSHTSLSFKLPSSLPCLSTSPQAFIASLIPLSLCCSPGRVYRINACSCSGSNHVQSCYAWLCSSVVLFEACYACPVMFKRPWRVTRSCSLYINAIHVLCVMRGRVPL